MEAAARQLLTPVLEQIYGLLWRLGILDVKENDGRS